MSATQIRAREISAARCCLPWPNRAGRFPDVARSSTRVLVRNARQRSHPTSVRIASHVRLEAAQPREPPAETVLSFSVDVDATPRLRALGLLCFTTFISVRAFSRWRPPLPEDVSARKLNSHTANLLCE